MNVQMYLLSDRNSYEGYYIDELKSFINGLPMSDFGIYICG